MQNNKRQVAVRAVYFSIFGNLALAIGKWLAGYFGHSYALIADAIESTSDIFSSILVLFGIKYSSRPADKNHPYGHGRLEPLITFMVVAFLVVSAIVIGVQSIKNIYTPHELPKGYTLIVLVFVILIKEIFYRFVNRKSKETKSTSLKADAWHHRSDAITSAAAFVGISIALIFGKGFESADDWAALLAAFFILYNSYLIFRPALGELMDEHLHEDLVVKIREISLEVPKVLGTEKCFIRKAGMHYHVDLHIFLDGNLSLREGHEIAHLVKDRILEKLPEILDVLIHVEPQDQSISLQR